MPKRLLLLLSILLLPPGAAAECGFVSGEQGMTIVVGSKSNRCFDSGSFRESFRQSLVASVRAMDGGAPSGSTGKKSFDDRSARAGKLWTIAERRHATLSNASFYGQR